MRRGPKSSGRRHALLLAIPSAVLATAGSLFFGIGPKNDVICQEQSGFERWLYDDRLGQVDGEFYTACVTPEPEAYAVAGGIGLITFGLVRRVAAGGSGARRDLHGTV